MNPLLFIKFPAGPPSPTDETATTPDATTATTTLQSLTANNAGPVLLKRFPRQANSPNLAFPATTQLPIQKSNVVAERIRLMAQEAESQPKKMATSPATPPNSGPAVSNIVTLYKVNGEAFESCDITGGQRIGQVKSQDPESHTGVITIAPALLSIADNYFLGENFIFYFLFLCPPRFSFFCWPVFNRNRSTTFSPVPMV